MITHGTPGNEAPITFSPGVCNCTWYHTDGMENCRCGSLARIGFPLGVCLPETTHAFEPGSISLPARNENRKLIFVASPLASIVIFCSSCRQVDVRLRYISRPQSSVSTPLQGRGS